MEAQVLWLTIVVAVGFWGCWWELAKTRRLLERPLSVKERMY